MSFFNNIGGLIQQFSGASPTAVESAATDHIGSMDTGDLVSHLTTAAQNMNTGSLGGLAQSLLGALSAHGHDEAKIQDGGIDTGAAQSGDTNAVTDLIAHAQQNPAALKDAAIAFIKNNPQAVEAFAPDFVKGLIAKFAG